ncbi:phytanoyl-CoA dioxygenase family protein [Streptomyces sp. ACA25]|uniref:2OG-Fe(II)-dependent halogenase WelO5 family protein n=1 Tax=Streptomyces sp. ACA25 TaxID=3022596 RepID=UPI002306EA51|nr:phytanoyl-CoA dioxygenase family protein [Streptomyces sp. ACA25]MDB1089558.1 phytanoyl-CoA dioxygenase family protein [Streptomyces sp. ACA25]
MQTAAQQGRYVYDSSTEAMTVHTLFDAVETSEPTRAQLTGLAAGTTGALHIRGFFSPAECDSVVRGIEEHPMGSYRFTPPMAKLGPAAYDYYKTGALGSEYFEQAEHDARVRSTLLAGSDPLTVALDRLSRAWGSPVEPARAQGRPLFAGLIREINNGARTHFDEISRECPTALDETPVAQLAFNCHLTVPEGGGEAVISRRRWKPSDEAHREGYGYSSRLVEDEPTVTLTPRLGDAVLFDPRNFHSVGRLTGGRRVTLSFFLGLRADGVLTVWS